MESEMVRAVQLNDVLKGLDLSRADGRAGLGALLREIQEQQADVEAASRPAAAGQGDDTTVYNAVPSASLDVVGVACGV